MLCCAWSLSRVQLFATLWTVAHQAPLSMGILLIEYWSELPCPPPGDLPNPKIEPRSLAFQVDYLPSEPPGKPKTTGVGSLSLLQRIFPTQEPNQGLLHCRWILYQLSYQGSLCRRWFYQKFKEDLILVFLKLLQNTEEKKTLTHLVRTTSPKRWYQRQSTKVKIIGEYLLWHLTRWLSGKEFIYQCKRQRKLGFSPWLGEDPWRMKWQPTAVFLPRKSHVQRSLVAYSP